MNKLFFLSSQPNQINIIDLRIKGVLIRLRSVTSFLNLISKSQNWAVDKIFLAITVLEFLMNQKPVLNSPISKYQQSVQKFLRLSVSTTKPRCFELLLHRLVFFVLPSLLAKQERFVTRLVCDNQGSVELCN
jgi:hypothetical protein